MFEISSKHKDAFSFCDCWKDPASSPVKSDWRAQQLILKGSWRLSPASVSAKLEKLSKSVNKTWLMIKMAMVIKSWLGGSKEYFVCDDVRVGFGKINMFAFLVVAFKNTLQNQFNDICSQTFLVHLHLWNTCRVYNFHRTGYWKNRKTVVYLYIYL